MKQLAMQEVETTLDEVIAALREHSRESATHQRETQLLIAYALSGLFGSDGPCSRSWH